MPVGSKDGSPVCLVIPPSCFLLDERVFIALGILKVAAVLEQAGIHVEMLDLSGVENYEEAIRYYARSSDAGVFGLTATTPQMPAASRISQVIRKVRAEAKIILGGPHVTLVHTAYKRECAIGVKGRAAKAFHCLTEMFDVLVAGDGEAAIFVALREDSPQIIDADDPKSSLFMDTTILNQLPFPARHLVDVDSYHYTIDGERALSLIAQLGCPFACSFCGGRQSPSLRRSRIRSKEQVLAEMAHIYHVYGVKGFMLYDDELNVNPIMVELMRAIAQMQRDLRAEFRLRGFIKSQLFTDEQAEAMRLAGFRWILVGFESGSPRILKNINKKATREENTRCVEIARRHGLKVKALMSIGHPGESAETIMQTRDWLLQVQPDDFDVTIITVYPGTPYYDHALPHSREDGVWVYTYNSDRLYSYEIDYTQVANYYKGIPDGGYTAFVYTDDLTADELVEIRDVVERDVRKALGVPFNHGAPSIRYEHSMGQCDGRLPANILRTTLHDSNSIGCSTTSVTSPARWPK